MTEQAESSQTASIAITGQTGISQMASIALTGQTESLQMAFIAVTDRQRADKWIPLEVLQWMPSPLEVLQQ